MGVEDLEWVEVTSRAQWREWLAANHTRTEGIWLVVFKKHCGDRYLAWPDIVRECLCFGWIDSRTKRVDEDRTRVMVTPRKPGSVWSAVNKKLLAELEAAGLMTPAGARLVEAAKEDGSWTWLDDIEARIVPDDLAAALHEAGARAGWDAIRPSQQKALLTSLKQAKRPATRQRRIAACVAASRV